jgi:hypothetical protein
MCFLCTGLVLSSCSRQLQYSFKFTIYHHPFRRYAVEKAALNKPRYKHSAERNTVTVSLTLNGGTEVNDDFDNPHFRAVTAILEI